jgi:ABC-type Fe3+-siderophore transport system permease subunit
LETTTVKLLLSVAALAGSLGLLLSDWAGQAFPYL